MLPANALPFPDRVAALPDALNRHLSASAAGDTSSVAAYLDRGAALIDPAALEALHHLRGALRAKLERLEESAHLRRRLELLVSFCEEAAARRAAITPARREAAFALLYFLKGCDRIPDTLPEVGLLDDAMIVQIVVQRHAAALRAHWHRMLRLPEREAPSESAVGLRAASLLIAPGIP